MSSLKRIVLPALILFTFVLAPIVALACNTLIDIAITKTGPATVAPGGTITYTMKMYIAGQPAPVELVGGSMKYLAGEVAMTDVIPDGLIFQPQNTRFTTAPDQYDAREIRPACVQQGNSITCIVPYMGLPQHGGGNGGRSPIGDITSVDIQLSFTVPASLACTTIRNTARTHRALDATTHYYIEANPANDTSTVTTTVDCAPSDISVVKTGDATVVAGNQVHYSLLVKNNGPNPADNVTVTDAFPAGLTYVPSSSDSRCVQQGINVSCTLGTMASGQIITLPLTFSVPATHACPATITNIVTVATTSQDSNPGNNQSSAQTTVTCIPPPQADVSIVKTANQTTILQGQNASFTLSIKNNGPDTAQNVTVTDPIPAGLTVFSISDNRCSDNLQGAITCNFGSMTNGQTIPVTITYKTTIQTTCSLHTNIATVATTTAGDNPANNQSSASMTVTCPVPQTTDLTIQKSGPSTPVPQGNVVTYTITASNSGPASAPSVTVRDTIPAGLTFLSGSSDNRCTQQGTDVVCSLNSMSASQTIVLTVVFQSSTQTACGELTNTATIATTGTETNTGNNSATAKMQLTCPPVTADVSIVKTDNRSSANTDETLAYVITLTNATSTDATGLTVTDTLPPNLTYLSASDSPSVNGQTITWTGLTVTKNSTRILTINARVLTNAKCSTLTNTVIVTGTQINHQASDITMITCPVTTYNPPQQYSQPSQYFYNPPVAYTAPVTISSPVFTTPRVVYTPPVVLPVTGLGDGSFYSPATNRTYLSTVLAKEQGSSSAGMSILLFALSVVLAVASGFVTKTLRGTWFV